MPSSPHDSWLLSVLPSVLPPAAVAQVRAARGSYWDAAVRAGADDDELVRAAASHYHVPVADVAAADPAAGGAVSEAVARRYGIVPLADVDGVLQVAASDPRDLDAERAVAFAAGRPVRVALASPRAIERLLRERYGTRLATRELRGVRVEVVSSGDESEEPPASAEAAAQRPVVALVDEILAQGVAAGASDIHIACEERAVSVRYRVDGVLQRARELPRDLARPAVSRLKVIGGLDIADRLRPQDGRARLNVDGRQVDLRISTLPAAHGEKVVLRLLRPGGGLATFEAMGFAAPARPQLEALLEARDGLVLVTGPTGAGKTTTLYAALRRVRERDVNIVTVEDPVEYRLPGVVQVQVNEKAGVSFAAALRAILRQDPDVVLVGEIRDRETAVTALQAALTGHLVLSTLHTLDAASAVARLADIGAEPYRVAAALRGVVGQRLLRRLCAECRRASSADDVAGAGRWLAGPATLWEPVGCAACGGTGYRGRFAVAEVLRRSVALERRVASAAPHAQIAEAARAGGMRPLWEAGLAHVRVGDTALAELLRVVEPPVAADHDQRTAEN
ncbi:MAG TPA: GspE/PulE family protein [Gemmatimonadaceae bacterium]|nr:GspE/PulE family protein [Gemmatimonadaceae bacterium]